MKLKTLSTKRTVDQENKKTERKNANEDEDIIPMADILSRLNDSSI